MKSDENYKKLDKLIYSNIEFDLASFCDVYREETALVASINRPEKSDYFFSIWFWDDGDIHIYAQEKNDHDFWHVIYEIYDRFTINDVHEIIEKLLFYKTKIRMKQGLLITSFSLFYFKNNKWEELLGNSYFKYGRFTFPKDSFFYSDAILFR